MVKNVLLDVIKHTSELGLYSVVKVNTTEEEISVESIDESKTVIFYGKLNTTIKELEGTIGLARLGVLRGYLNFPDFTKSSSTITVNTKSLNGATVPSDVVFDSGDGNQATYRFMGEVLVNEQLKVPSFRGAKWNVVVSPTKEGISSLVYMNGVLGAFEDVFTVSTSNGNLEFSIGAGSSDKTKIVFAKNVEGDLKHGWSFPISPVLTILKLYPTSKRCEMFISDAGALKIEIESETGVYQYILPAKTQ